MKIIKASSNGRTTDFESVNLGSSPRALIILLFILTSCESDYANTRLDIQNLKIQIDKQQKLIDKQQKTIDLEAELIIKYTNIVDERLNQIDDSYGCEQWSM